MIWLNGKEILKTKVPLFYFSKILIFYQIRLGLESYPIFLARKNEFVRKSQEALWLKHERMDVTLEALEAAVEAAVQGNHVGDIGAAVVRTVEGTGFGIIRELVGHGVGRDVHEEPQVPNIGRAGHGPLLREGMVLAIEPMLSEGSANIRTLDDGWTVVTADRKLAAHFEHTVGITAGAPRILTSVGGAVGAGA